jgi:hypothetical protein
MLYECFFFGIPCSTLEDTHKYAMREVKEPSEKSFQLGKAKASDVLRYCSLKARSFGEDGSS